MATRDGTVLGAPDNRSATPTGLTSIGCSPRNLGARYRCARNPLRHGSICARPRYQNPEIAKPAKAAGPAYPAEARGLEVLQLRSSLTSPILASPFGVHRQSAPKDSRFWVGCAATPEAPLLSISAVLPGFSQTRSPWPVWRGSVAGPVRFATMSRKAAAKLWHKARRWDRDTRQ